MRLTPEQITLTRQIVQSSLGWRAEYGFLDRGLMIPCVEATSIDNRLFASSFSLEDFSRLESDPVFAERIVAFVSSLLTTADRSISEIERRLEIVDKR